jgi:hypothetical protein
MHLKLALLLTTMLGLGTAVAVGGNAAVIAADARVDAAGDAQASDASILEMLQVMDAEQLVAGLKEQVNAMVSASMQQALRGKKMTPEVQAVIGRMQAKMLATADQMLSWDVLKPIYLRTYRESFTQDEMDSIIAFYKTPGGQALIKKMPTVMKNALGEILAMIAPMQQKFQQIQREALDELNALPATPATPKT